MEKPRPYYNTKTQVSELESLLSRLPDSSSPERGLQRKAAPKFARQLDTNQVQELIVGYQAG